MTKISLILAMVLCLVLVPQAATAAPTSNSLSIPITGTGSAGTFNGVFNLTNFAVQNGQLIANGIVTGTLTSTTGVVTSILQNVTAVVATPTSANCNILHLVIGPINLNVLGLSITTNQIVLDITAIPGPGNLLGNLLCTVANLLNNTGGLADLLNQIVSILRGL